MKKLIALLLVWFTVGIAATTLAGYIIRVHQLASWVADGTPMAVSTATAFVALSVAILLRWKANHEHHNQ